MDRFTGVLIGLLLAIACSWYINKSFENADRQVAEANPVTVLKGEAVSGQ